MINKIMLLITTLSLFLLISCGIKNNDGNIEEIKKQLDIGIIELGSEKLKIIKSQLDSILKNEPKNHKALIELARYYIKTAYKKTNHDYTIVYDQEILKEAKKALDKSLEINSNYADTYIYYGNYYEGILNYDKALEAFQKADKLGTINPWLYTRWATLLLAQKKPDEAASLYEKVIELSADNKTTLASANEFLARHHERLGNLDLANNYYLKVIEILPKNAWIRGSYSQFLRSKLDKIDDALKYAEEALTLAVYGIGRGIYADALYAKWAKILKEEPNSKEAEVYFTRANSLQPNLATVALFVGGNEINRYVADALFDYGLISIDEVHQDTGMSLLSQAIYAGYDGFVPNEKFAKYLLEKGANPNVYNTDGWTPLLLAVDDGLFNIVKLLMQHGANPEMTHGESTYNALYLAKKRKHDEITNYMSSYQEINN